MPVLAHIQTLWRNLRRRGRVERDLDDELQSTLELLVEERVAGGMPPVEARRLALVELRIEPLKEAVRDRRAGARWDALGQDLRYAWRHIQGAPAFAVVAVLTLALGIGANTAMFSMLNALLLTRLPIDDPDGLVAIRPRSSRGQERSTPVSAVDVLRDGPLDPLCGYLGSINVPVLANGTPVHTSTTFVTGRCFEAFGVTPGLGRAITEDDAPIYGAGARVAVISHRLWTTVYGADPGVLGRTLLVNNVEVSIIGVLPRAFVGLEVDFGIDIFTPFDAVVAAGPTRRQLASFLLGRLRPGTTLPEAAAEIETRWPALLEAVLPAAMAPSEREQLRDSSPGVERLGTGTSRNRTRYVRPLTLILGLTSLLLLLTCVNLGGLLLARATARSGELAVRLALGGTRWRIAQQMLMESLILSISGAALALPLAYAIASVLPAFMTTPTMPITMSFTPDARVLAVTTLIAIAVSVLMSALPVWVAMRRGTDHPTRWDRTIAGATSRWVRGLLVAQVALSAALLLGAVLLTRSLYLLQTADPGVRTDNVLVVQLGALPGAPYNRGNREAYYPPLLAQIAALPGVQAVSLADRFPRVTVQGRGVPVTFVGEAHTGVETSIDYVSPSFFEMMGIELLDGSAFTWAHRLDTRPVAVVSESLARALAPGGTLLERHVTLRTLPQDQEMAIIGVVSDATQGDPRTPRPLVIYRPALQLSATSAFTPNLLIATTDAATAGSGVREVLRGFGRDYPREIIALGNLLSRAPGIERMSAIVAAGVGGLAVVLAFIGVHGALAYAVSRRRREIGVRVALGATPAEVARGVVRDGVVLTLLGLAVGLPLASVAARSLRSLMFGITESDVVTYVVVGVFFTVLGVAAVAVPARRAALVDPVKALRAE